MTAIKRNQLHDTVQWTKSDECKSALENALAHMFCPVDNEKSLDKLLYNATNDCIRTLS